MILRSKLTILVSIILFFISSLLIWQFLLSIYEVKFRYDFDPKNLKLNKIYKIECVGINSVGWELTFRDTKFICNFDKGESKINTFPNPDKNILYFSLIEKGELKITLNSKFSLNPTKLFLISE